MGETRNLIRFGTINGDIIIPCILFSSFPPTNGQQWTSSPFYHMYPLPPSFGYLFFSFFFFFLHTATSLHAVCYRAPCGFPVWPRSARYTPDGAVSSASISRPRQPRLPRVLRFEQISCFFFFFPSSFWTPVSLSRSTCIGVPLPPVIRPSTNRHRQPFPGGVLGISVPTNRKGWWNEKSRSLNSLWGGGRFGNCEWTRSSHRLTGRLTGDRRDVSVLWIIIPLY